MFPHYEGTIHLSSDFKQLVINLLKLVEKNNDSPEKEYESDSEEENKPIDRIEFVLKKLSSSCYIDEI